VHHQEKIRRTLQLCCRSVDKDFNFGTVNVVS
jgi:hypothetical protein